MEFLRKQLVKLNLATDLRVYDSVNAWRSWSTGDLLKHYGFWSSEVWVDGWSKEYVEKMSGMVLNIATELKARGFPVR
jgi:hypothetical protein